MKAVKYLVLICVFISFYTGNAQVYTSTFTTVEQDSYVTNAYADSTFGSEKFLFAHHDSLAGETERFFLEYDLTSVPENAIIVEATLTLYAETVTGSSNLDLYVERLDSLWYEDSITWNNQTASYFSDQISIGNSITSVSGFQDFDVTDHVEHFVDYDHLSNGWFIGLQDEVSSGDHGIKYASSDHDSVSWRPSLEVKYILPPDISVNVTHCTNGNHDGSIDLEVTGGSGAEPYYAWFYHVDDGVFTGYGAGNNFDFEDYEQDTLKPGLYVIYYRDSLYSTQPSNDKYLFTKWFLVGEEGDTTSVKLWWTENYIEDVRIGYNLDTRAGADKYEDINYEYTNSLYAATHLPGPYVSYHNATLINYQLDIDAGLDVTSSTLTMVRWTKSYRCNTCTNETYFRPVTEYWKEHIVTWNTRPAVDSTVLATSDGTNPGNTYVEKYDTLDFLPMVEYWQDNPDKNYGFEIALSDYDQPGLANRPWRDCGFGANGHKLWLDFVVKPSTLTEFNDSLELGSIEVNAPAGELPFHYLISYHDSIPEFTDIWSTIKDSIDLDSASFFRGDINSRNFKFENLKAERYYVGVYDNSGEKLIEHEVILGPTLNVYDSTNISLVDRTIQITTPDTSGYLLFDGQIPKSQAGGIEFRLDSLDAFAIGFNRMTDDPASSERDLEFVLDIAENGNYQIKKADSLFFTGTASEGDYFRISKKNYEVIFYQNDYEVYRTDVNKSLADDYVVEGVFKGPDLVISQISKLEGLIKPIYPIYTEVHHTECELDNGYLELYPSPFFGTGGSISGSVVVINEATQVTESTINFNGNTVDQNVPLAAGYYKVEYSWTNGSSTFNWVEYHLIGQAITWDLQDQYFTYVSGTTNTIKSTDITNTADAQSVNQLPDGELGSVSYYTTTQKYYPLWGTGQFTIVPFVNTRLKIVDEQGDPEMTIKVVMLAGNNYVFAYDENDVLINTPFIAYNNGPYVISLESGSPDQFKAYYNESTTAFATNDQSSSGNYKVYASALRGSFYEAYATFCYGLPTSEQCAHLDYELDGNYYVTLNGKLCFVYYEEYNDTDIAFNIFDNAGQLIYTETDFSVPNLVHGENRIVLDFYDFDCSNQGFYILEVINDKGEKFYLRFYYNGDGQLSNWQDCYEGLDDF